MVATLRSREAALLTTASDAVVTWARDRLAVGLIEHRSKRSEPALEIVREAILGLREAAKAAVPGKAPAKQRRARS